MILLKTVSKNRFFLHEEGYVCIEIIHKKHGIWFALLDVEDVDKATKYSLNLHRQTETRMYAATKVRRADGGYTILRLHQLVFPIDGAVDHKNRCGLDNRKTNLRPATNTENTHNASMRCDSKNEFKGITLMPFGNYRARIEINGERLHLGMFATAEEAARAYDAAAIIHHGAFAGLNFDNSKPPTITTHSHSSV